MPGGPDGSAFARDIARQPVALAALSERAAAFAETGREHLSPPPCGRLLVCGCGDGLFAAEAARAYAEDLGLDWRPAGALDVVLSAGRLRPADRVIAISMSGNVDRTVEAAAAAASRGVPLVALVNGGGGRLATVASRTISLDLPDVAPFLCGTATYTATILALMMLARGAAGRSGALPLPAIMAAQTAVLDETSEVVERLAVPTGVRVLAAGADRGTVQYGAAKLVETTSIPAWSGDLEEFAHSQYWAMPATDLVVVVAVEPALARYADESCAALRELGVETLAIESRAAPVMKATRRIALPALDPSLAPLATAIPLQILAGSMASRTGLDPDTRRHLKDDATRFRVSRLLTRRSLLGTGQ